jgi:hypothetical protein
MAYDCPSNQPKGRHPVQAKPNDIKKHITYGSKGSIPSYLAVNTVGGTLWATNKYWLTYAERVAPLLEQYNLPADEPGVYQVNGTVTRASDQVPNISAYAKNARDFEPGIRVKVAGQPAFTLGGRGDALFAMFLLADGTHAGLMESELAWLSDTSAAPRLPEGCHYGEVRVSFCKSGSDKPPQAMIRANVIRTLEKAHYGDDGRGEYVPAVTESAEPVVLGYMMGVNYGA